MDILAIAVLIIALVKKDKRCLPVCIIACVYAGAHTFSRLPAMLGTIFFEVFSVVNIPILVALLVTSILVFQKPFENGKRYISPIVLSASVLFVKIVRKAFHQYQLQQFLINETVTMDRYDVLVVGYTIIDAVYTLLFLGLMICIIVVVNRGTEERKS